MYSPLGALSPLGAAADSGPDVERLAEKVQQQLRDAEAQKRKADGTDAEGSAAGGGGMRRVDSQSAMRKSTAAAAAEAERRRIFASEATEVEVRARKARLQLSAAQTDTELRQALSGLDREAREWRLPLPLNIPQTMRGSFDCPASGNLPIISNHTQSLAVSHQSPFNHSLITLQSPADGGRAPQRRGCVHGVRGGFEVRPDPGAEVIRTPNRTPPLFEHRAFGAELSGRLPFAE